MSSENPQPKKATSTLPAAAEPTDIPPFVAEEVYDFWKKYGRSLGLAAVLGLTAVAGIEGTKLAIKAKEQKIQDSYLAVADSAGLQAFAKDHSSHELATIAWMKLGNESMEQKDYAAALERYAAAASARAPEEIKAIALLGKAAAQLELGSRDDAKATLQTLALTDSNPQSVRAEALFKRLVLAIDDGEDPQQIEGWKSQLELLDTSSFWTQRLNTMSHY
ncbi:MAG: tetratricopeptide repeat protein [Opitutales bacterium]|nr:tetratricopeptide repeat protein [Opitutales bacterium]